MNKLECLIQKQSKIKGRHNIGRMPDAIQLIQVKQINVVSTYRIGIRQKFSVSQS